MAETHSPRITWKDSFAIGDALIDAQHRAFLVDLDRVMDAVEGGADRDVVIHFYRRFLADLTQHFHDEEAMLARAGFPELEIHADEHRALLSSVTAIENMLISGNGPSGPHLVIRSLMSSLIEHLISEDMRYKAWLKRRG